MRNALGGKRYDPKVKTEADIEWERLWHKDQKEENLRRRD
jgi:hypothetical protein